jgi:hypothetical protein
VAHASVVCLERSIAHISSDKALVLWQAESPRARQALMRHAGRDRVYPGVCEAVLAPRARLSLPAWYGFLLLSERQAEPRDASPIAGSETAPWHHPRCPGLAPRAADTLLTPRRGVPPRAHIATASACMLPTPSRILHAHGGKRRRRVSGGEAAAPWRNARTVSWCPPVAVPPHTSRRRLMGCPAPGAADKAASLMRCKSSAVNCLVRTASISDACEGNDTGSARMEKSRLPCGVMP